MKNRTELNPNGRYVVTGLELNGLFDALEEAQNGPSVVDDEKGFLFLIFSVGERRIRPVPAVLEGKCGCTGHQWVSMGSRTNGCGNCCDFFEVRIAEGRTDTSRPPLTSRRVVICSVCGTEHYENSLCPQV